MNQRRPSRSARRPFCRPPAGLALAPVLAAIAALPSAWAQSGTSQVVEITAQKRVERIQDVPLAVTAITADALEARGIEAASNLSGTVPTLHMATAPGAGLVAAVGMRGLASGQPAIWADPSVGLYIDGVFVGKNMGALFDLVELTRVEALRGPQGTLFGRNTEAGAVNFITRKPTGLFGGVVQFEAGNDGRQVGRVSVDLPKTGPLSATLAARSERQDGFVASANGGDAFGNKHRDAARLALRLEATKGLTIDYAYDHTDIDEMPPVSSLISSRGYGSLYQVATTQIGGTTYAFQNPSCLQTNGSGACVFPSPGIGPALRAYESTAYPSSIPNDTRLGPLYQRLKLDGHTLQAEYALSRTDTLRYIGSLRKMKYGDNSDLDQTPVFVFGNARDIGYDTQSHELQWVGNAGSLRHVLGYYSFRDEGQHRSRQAGGLLTFHPDVASYQMANFDISTRAQAVFGQLDYDIGRFGIGVGGRYTEERKTVQATRFRTNASFVQQGANTVDLAGEHQWTAFTPTFNLLYRLSKDQNLFARVARGFKSGGFPAEAPVVGSSSAPNKPFDPETSTAVELGIKGSLAGGTLQYSADIFQMDVKDAQVSLLPAGSLSPTLVNAGKLRTQGLELDATWRASEALKLTLAYGYLEAKFRSYLTLNASNQPIDAASNTVVPGAPRHTLSLTADSRLATLGDGMPLRGVVDLRYLSERYTYPGVIDASLPNAAVGNSAAESRMPALTLLNLRLSLGNIRIGGPGEGEVALFVKNALDQRRLVAHVDISGFYQVGTWSDPRTYGASVAYRW